MSYDEMELDTIGDRKTALFVIISDTDDTFNFVVAIMFIRDKVRPYRTNNLYAEIQQKIKEQEELQLEQQHSKGKAYVEDAGTAIYDTIPKKPAARESIRDKLKSAQKAQPPHTTKPQKNKGKDMEL